MGRRALLPGSLLLGSLQAVSAVLRPLGSAMRVMPTIPRLGHMRMAADSLGRPDVCIVGGGFGGLYTALKLGALGWEEGCAPRVTLIDRSDRFVFLPMLYEITTGTVSCWEVAPRFEELLAGSSVNFVHGDVTAIDTESGLISVRPAPKPAAPAKAAGAVTSASGLSLPYDHAVLSMGAGPSFGGVPGAAELAMPFYSLDDALALRKKLLPLSRSSAGRCQLAIVGGSYVGVELAANLADWLTPHGVQITLVHRSEALLSTSEEFSRMVAQSRLESRGVRVLLETSVQSVLPGQLSLKSSSSEDISLDADLVVWCAGTKPSSLAHELGLPLDPRGRIRTDAFLAVDGAANLHALGDVAAATDASGAAPPSTAQAAMQQADYAAWNTRAALQGTKPLPFR